MRLFPAHRIYSGTEILKLPANLHRQQLCSPSSYWVPCMQQTTESDVETKLKQKFSKSIFDDKDDFFFVGEGAAEETVEKF